MAETKDAKGRPGRLGASESGFHLAVNDRLSTQIKLLVNRPSALNETQN
jgi:hypothetical protein